jgi:hypothetical protein
MIARLHSPRWGKSPYSKSPWVMIPGAIRDNRVMKVGGSDDTRLPARRWEPDLLGATERKFTFTEFIDPSGIKTFFLPSGRESLIRDDEFVTKQY